MGKGEGAAASPVSARWGVVVWVVMALATAAMVLFAVSLATNHWLDTTVYPQTVATANANDPLFYSRYQGLFTTCYTGGDVLILAAETQQRNARRDTLMASGDQCILDDGIIVFATSGTKYTADYVTRAHSLRSVVGLMAAGIFFVLIGLLVNLCGLCNDNGKSAIGAGVLYLLACGCGVGATVLFAFQVVRLQNDVLKTEIEFSAGWLAETKYTEPAKVTNHSISYGWSFIVANIAAGLALFAAIISFVATCVHKSDDEGAGDEKKALAKYNAANAPATAVAQKPPMQQGNDVIRAPAQESTHPQPPAAQPFKQQPLQPQPAQPQAIQQAVEPAQPQPIQQVVQQPIMVPVQQAAARQPAAQLTRQQPVAAPMSQDPNAYYNYPHDNIATYRPTNPMPQQNVVPVPAHQILGNGVSKSPTARAYYNGPSYFERELGESQRRMNFDD